MSLSILKVFFYRSLLSLNVKEIFNHTTVKMVNKPKSVRKLLISNLCREAEGLSGGLVVKNLPASAGVTGSIPGPGRSRVPRSS